MVSPRHLAVLVVFLLPALTLQLAEAGLRLPEGLELTGDLQAFAIDDNDTLAIAAARERDGRIGSTVTIHDANGSQQRIELNLRIRDLIWLDDGRLLAVGFRAARRTKGEAFLLVWDPGRTRFKRVMRLPPTARDLTYGDRPDRLLLTARNELRVITLPLLRSGPLYRVLGENRVATVLEGSRVLVGQSDALLLIDLNDRQSREQMPVQERLTLSSPVEQLSTAADGRNALAVLLDRSALHVRVDPLRVEAAGNGHVVSSMARPAPDTGSPVNPQPPVHDIPPPAPLGDPVEEIAAPQESQPRSASASDSQIHGQVTGVRSALVTAVVAFGPNSLLREAARISPAADGSFDFGRLPSGRYRIQLDAGGDKLLMSEPAFHILDVTDESNFSLGFRVLQAR